MKTKKQGILLSFLLLALLLSACGPPSASLSSTLTEFDFEPATWTVPANAEVELTLINDGTVFHNWVLMPPEDEVAPPYTRDEWQQSLAEFRVRGGESETFTFTAPSEPGEYPVLCTEGGHFEFGMVGTLIVE